MTYFIAEVSSNHSKNKERAFSFIDTASQIGCKAVKFQLFKMDKLFSAEVMKNSPEHINRKNWELPLDLLPYLSERCKKNKIQFGCTPFYIDAVYELERYVDFYKVASYELLWDDLLIACARTNKPLIVSTGMANMEEINHAVDILRSNNCKPTFQ